MTLESKHKELIDSLKSSGALKTRKIISAFLKVKRREFMPESVVDQAYVDAPISIGEGQTISQPTTVGIAIEALEPRSGHKILEIGTGSGYQSAILAEIVGNSGLIITLERLPLLYEFSKNNLKNYKNVQLSCSDGTKGYPYKAPYDRIVVAAEATKVPRHLIAQLKQGGILVIPVKGRLLKIQKSGQNIDTKKLGEFAFVPLVGDY